MGETLGIIAALGASALVIEKVVSFLRNAFDKAGRLSTFWWNVTALVLGVCYTLGWQINLAPALAALVPALSGSTRLTGVSGQVLTGLAIGAASGFWYATFQALEATVTRNSATPTVVKTK